MPKKTPLSGASANIDYHLLSHISHEMRSPFNGLIGFSDLLDTGFDSLPDNRKKEYIHLLKILIGKAFLNQQTVVAWLKFISNNFNIIHSSVSVTEMMTKAIQYNASDIENKLINININEHKERDIAGDAIYLSLAFSNLISFILHFANPSASIELSSSNSSNTNTVIIIQFQTLSESEKLYSILELLANGKVAEIPESETPIWVAGQIFSEHKTKITLHKELNNVLEISLQFT